jgi:hypothetical protein
VIYGCLEPVHYAAGMNGTINFTDSEHGSVTTPEGTWTTTDGGQSWHEAP